MASLKEMIAASAHMDAIGAWLDGLEHEARVAQVTGLSAGELAALYALADGRDVELDHFVPAGAAPGVEVVHHGVNSLPVIGGTFRKRFTRAASGDELLYGFNDNDGFVSSIGWFTGPGYFAVRPRGCNNPDGRSGSDQLFIDYYEQPEETPMAGWPDPKPAMGWSAGLVFGQMCDYMWRVSEHVSIGAAWKKGKPVGQYFALVRTA